MTSLATELLANGLRLIVYVGGVVERPDCMMKYVDVGRVNKGQIKADRTLHFNALSK
jgi:hypothetical protein